MNPFRKVKAGLGYASQLALLPGGASRDASWTGIKQMGAAGIDTWGISVATDAGGNIHVAGTTQGGLDGNTLMGTADFFVTKFSSMGSRQYTRQLGVRGAATWGYSVATDAGGNVYVTGYTNGALDGNTLTGTRDLFLTKYNGSGEKQYTHQVGVAGALTWGNSVATDAVGNVYVAGTTQGGLDGNRLMGTSDLFVIKYDSNGVRQFTRQLGVTGAATYAYAVATDAVGSFYVTGLTYGGLHGNTLAGTSDLFLIKYDSNGVRQFTRQLGVAGAATFGYSVATDAGGNVYVAGQTYGSLDGNVLAGTSDLFVIKYDSRGAKQYTRQLGAAWTTSYAYSVATDADGSMYVAGVTKGGLDGNTLAGTTDHFVIKFDSNGAKQYTRQLGVAGADVRGASVATDADGNAYLAGWTSGSLDGNARMGTRDCYVAKYDSRGVRQ